jgi:hypothetical protein
VVQNANPDTALSWVNFVLTYGTLSPPAIRGARGVIPWHNSAYKRSALEPFAKRLGTLLEWEGELQNELIAAGWQLCLEPAARTSHVNVSTGWSTIALGFQRGRLMAAERARHNSWSPVRKLLYVLACPALTLVLLRDLVPVMRRMELAPSMTMRMLPALLLTSMSTALGMGFGYAAGSAGAVERIEDLELNRYRHVTRSDWAVLEITEQPR